MSQSSESNQSTYSEEVQYYERTLPDITQMLKYAKIDKTNLKIGSLSSDINTKESSINNDMGSIKLQIRNIDESEQSTRIE